MSADVCAPLARALVLIARPAGRLWQLLFWCAGRAALPSPLGTFLYTRRWSPADAF